MLDLREFDDMVEDTCQRIIDSDIGITNVSVGSVTRTLIEAIMAEVDIMQFTIYQAYIAKTVDEAEGEDLDDVVSILGVIRRSASYCTGTVTFSVTEESDIDIEIPSGSIVSTALTINGEIYEFEVIEDSILSAGDMSVDVNVRCTAAGRIFIPAKSITVINDSIFGIAEVINNSDISGGINDETDDELRDRAKDALTKLGRGTVESIKAAVKDIGGVIDCNVYDMRSGVGTVDVFVITETMPTPQELIDEISNVIKDTKAAGIRAYLKFPDIEYVDIDCNIKTSSDVNYYSIYELLFNYINNMTIGVSLIINQLDKLVLNTIDDNVADITFNTPNGNVMIGADNVIRVNSIKINDVIYYTRNEED